MMAARKVLSFACATATLILSIGFGAAERASAASVTVVNSGRPDLTVFLLDGQIVGGETLQLEALISKMPANQYAAIILNSPGGSLVEGLKLGRLFYRARIATSVLGHGGGCHSACAIAFLGGRDHDRKASRIKMTGGNLGFHQFNRVRTAADMAKKYNKIDMQNEMLRTHAVTLSIVEYLADIGEDMQFLHLMLKAPNVQINLISNEDALTYGIHVMDEQSEQVIDSTNVRLRVEGR
jgi:hypothetical protein